ncbi:FTS and Hook-interacting protein-like isoform X1 [Varroa destructor]|uniref:FHF complex subunit HOOK-interacting protein C-terminal domain-containing protein n=1 Tax=Varroa destructor TaxID=109461 RepID=A0A7M7JEW3_VARDE|nr:FTS and Hook-interacting protein-like isoform X1 [Varroa destructor]XP_022651039.1 FTS and Hook-interacting protein-like isoform X1 [Varroa destructor]
MSWLRKQGSFRLRRPAAILKNADPRTLLEAFREHCTQASALMQRWDLSLSLSVRQDDVAAIVNHLEQMVNYILEECAAKGPFGPGGTITGPPSSVSTLSSSTSSSAPSPAPSLNSYAISPILDYILDNYVLEKVLDWSLQTAEFTLRLLEEQLRIFEILTSNCSQRLLYQKGFLSPLQKLLSICESDCPEELERRLVALLNTLCVTLSQNADLLQIFFNPRGGDTGESHGPPRFLVFSLLVPYVHREGQLGHQARDALLLCMCLAAKNHARVDELGKYMANHSNFCPILATGLSGLYSVLPRKLEVCGEDWYRLSEEDVQDLPALGAFLCSLEFCNAVTQVSHPLVRDQLLDYLLHGFLIPVMGPALYQSNTDEIVTTTVYLELFLRKVTEPRLMRVFLHFLLTTMCERRLLVDILILRIGAHSKLAIVTIALFKTLLDLNCEEVMFELVFKYLIPCSHVMVSHRERMRDVDTFCVTAQRLLSLAPSQLPPVATNKSTSGYLSNAGSVRAGSVPPTSFNGNVRQSRSYTEGLAGASRSTNANANAQDISDQFQISYLAYLLDAKNGIRACRDACQVWSRNYDGSKSDSRATVNGPVTGVTNMYLPGNCISSANDRGSSSGTSSSIKNQQQQQQHINGAGGNEASIALNVGAPMQCHNGKLAEEKEDSGIFVNDQKDFGGADIGPFLTQVLSRLECITINDVYTNLQLTSLISRLALYPQPLLRSFLLSQEIVFQPSIRSLYQVLCGLRHKIEQLSIQLGNYPVLLSRAREFFAARENVLNQPNLTLAGSIVGQTLPPAREKSAMNVNPPAQRRRSLGTFFRKFSALQPIADNSGYRYIVKLPYGEKNASNESDSSRSNSEAVRAQTRAILSIVIFDEFVKELAAISQEHSLQQLLDEVPAD